MPDINTQQGTGMPELNEDLFASARVNPTDPAPTGSPVQQPPTPPEPAAVQPPVPAAGRSESSPAQGTETSHEDIGEPEKQDDAFEQAKETSDAPAAPDGAPAEVNPAETEQVRSLWQMLEEGFGFQDRLEEEYLPKNVEELTKMMQDLIQLNSKPKYASADVEAFDRYVKAGGDPYSYLQTIGDTDYSAVKLETELDQQTIVARELSLRGFTDGQIRATLDAYQKAGNLKDMADQSLNTLKTYQQNQKQEAVRQQEMEAAQMKRQQQEAIDSVVAVAKSTDTVFGAKLTEAERYATIEYMFRQDSKDGQTAFARDLFGDPKKAFLAAYLLRKGESALAEVSKSAQKTAAERFRQTIARQNASVQMPSVKHQVRQGSDKPRPLTDFLP